MANQHTPGPWYCFPSDHGGEFIIQGSNEVGGGPVLPILGRTHNWPKNAEANARLIAAAPDMLMVCQLLAFWDAGKGDDFLSDACSFARAAIAKAEGAQP